MRVALLTLTRGGISGGFRKYLDHLVPALREQSGIDDVHVFLPPAIASQNDLSWPLNDELRGFAKLRRSVADLKPDVIFIPTSRVVHVGEIPTVTMVRNMEPLEVPFEGNTITESVRNIGRVVAARWAARRSTRVIAVSRHVRDYVIRRWRIDDERIGVVYHGVDPVNPSEPRRPALLASIEERRFLFAAGSIRPARGLEDLIIAAATLPDDLRIVFAGSVDHGAEGYAAKMRRLAADLGVASRITWTGQLDEESMSWCYRNASTFVMTSRAEACPNVVLEALAHGAISVSTDHPPMPEFFGEAAMYYRERDAGDLAKRLGEALTLAKPEKARRRERARARAGDFTWAGSAAATERELRLAVLRGRSSRSRSEGGERPI